MTLMLVEELGMTPELQRRHRIAVPWRDRTTDRIVAEFDYRDIDVLTIPMPCSWNNTKRSDARDIALGLTFKLYRERELTDLIQNDDGVEITVQAPDGSRETIAVVPIGADGDTGHANRSTSISRDYLAGTLHHRVHHYDFEEAAGYRYRNYVAHPEQWCAMIKVPT